MTNRIAKEYEDLGEPVTLAVYTKSPQKWLLVDRETGQAYEGNAQGHWDKLIAKLPNPDKPEQEV